MGSYSMSCALSGLEIGFGDEALVFTVDPRIERIISYPVFGVYDDYGRLRLNDNTEYDPLKVDRDEVTENDDTQTSAVWVRREAFDLIPSLPTSDSFGDETISDDLEEANDFIRDQIVHSRRLINLIGSGLEVGPYANFISEYIIDGLSDDEIVDRLQTIVLLYRGFSELRRPMVLPEYFNSPQHGGFHAFRKFYGELIKLDMDKG